MEHWRWVGTMIPFQVSSQAPGRARRKSQGIEIQGQGGHRVYREVSRWVLLLEGILTETSEELVLERYGSASYKVSRACGVCTWVDEGVGISERWRKETHSKNHRKMWLGWRGI